MFDKEKIKNLLFSEAKSGKKIASSILVLALLSSIIKSLENSFSSSSITTVTNYIVFITAIPPINTGFKAVDVIGNPTKTNKEIIIGIITLTRPIIFSIVE